MKVELSAYLSAIRPKAKELVERLLKDYAYVSLLGTDAAGKRYMMKRTGVDLGDAMLAERGFVIRAHNGQGYGEVAFNDLDDTSYDLVKKQLEAQIELSKLIKDQQAIATNQYELLTEEAMTEDFTAEVGTLPSMVSHETKLEKMRDIMNKMLALSEDLVDARVVYEELKTSKIFISKEKDLSQAYIWTNAYVIPIASKEGKVKYIHTVKSGLKGVEILDELLEVYEDSISTLSDMMTSVPMIAGEYDVILDPEVSGLVAHEAFGHGVEMDMFVKERAKAAHFMNKEVASKYVNMYDGAASAKEVSSYFFDDEGTLAGDTKIIDDGILKAGICDALSAMKLGVTPTGNGKRQSYEHKVYTRMTNTFFAQGEDKLEDMIKSIDYGFLLESYDSGMEDPKNWGIQCVISRGREIKDGQLTGKVFAPVMMTGYVPDLLKSMTMVSGDLDLTGGGYCGKGYKEFVKTSTGGPYIKARGRLS